MGIGIVELDNHWEYLGNILYGFSRLERRMKIVYFCCFFEATMETACDHS